MKDRGENLESLLLHPGVHFPTSVLLNGRNTDYFSCRSPGNLKNFFLVHGETDSLCFHLSIRLRTATDRPAMQ
jgi:hypothetical protein